MIFIAGEIGMQVAPPANRYTLFVSHDMYKDGEYEKDKVAYGSRFDLECVMTDRADFYVKRVLQALHREKLDPHDVVVQLPKSLSRNENRKHLEHLAKKAPGIRFMIMDTTGLKAEKERAPYRRDIYSILLLARHIQEDDDEDSGIYRLLMFLVTKILGDRKVVEAGAYVYAVANGDINGIVNTVLSYKPVEKYDMPKYEAVSRALVSA